MRPVNYSISPFVADPALVFDILPSRVNLPLTASRNLKLMPEPSLELKLLPFIYCWLECMSSRYILDYLLFLNDLLKLHSIECLILPRTRIVHILNKRLAFFFSLPFRNRATVNSFVKILCCCLCNSWISSKMHSHQTLCPS